MWYREVFTVRRVNYVYSSRVFTPAYCTVCTPSPCPVSAFKDFNNFSRHLCLLAALDEAPSSAGVSFYINILSRFIHNMSEITRREQSGSDPSYTPAGPCPLRPARTSRRAARPSDGAQKRKQAELKKKKTDALPKMTSFFPTNQLESGKDNNVCQESQSLSSVRKQIDKNSTTGTSDDHFDDDEINSEIKTPVPVPDKSEPFIVAIPEVSKIELLNSNKNIDAGLWTEFSEEDICYWIDHGPENCQHHQGPFHESRRTYASGKSVRFCTPRLFFGKKANGETYKREWLLYSKTKGSLYCFVCKLFGNKSIATAPSQFAADGFSDWRNVIAIEHHENSSAHKDFMLTYLSRRQGLGITKNLETQVKEERKYWQNVLQRVIAAIQTLAERGLAFRGHDESFESIHNGIFLGLLELVAQFDPFLASHIARYGNKGKGNPSYLSKTVCDELIDLMSDKFHKVIVEEIQSAGYFSLSVDSTPDLSHTDQLSIILRYVSPSDSMPVERFLTFLNLESHTGEEMANIVLSYLEGCKISAEDNHMTMLLIFLKELIGNDSVLKSLSNTRWEAHAVATSAILQYYPKILDALDEIAEDTNRKGETSKGLQEKGLDLKTCSNLYHSLSGHLVEMRNQFEKFEGEARKFFPNGEYMETRRRIRKKQVNNGNAEELDLNPRDKFRIETFNVIIDTLNAQMQRRGDVYHEVSQKFSFLADLIDACLQHAACNPPLTFESASLL
ncbi:Zinc finger MYM-type protein 1 [Eumeta japonica]|uniref:Zinc finger MYM-type protein 1 n=1 Tax=Eumeta variegata TaxID=151549 RepID=A0A4C1ZQR1_EUMVA|nr:Zinc finger MYM-type protein 1 [Eumeta japonica]